LQVGICEGTVVHVPEYILAKQPITDGIYITCQNAKIPDPELGLLKYWSTSFSNEIFGFDDVTRFRPRISIAVG
jgi:hypothetical protein